MFNKQLVVRICRPLNLIFLFDWTDMRKLLPALIFLLVFASLNQLLAQAPAFNYGSAKTYPAGTVITPVVPTNTGGAIPGDLYGQASTVYNTQYRYGAGIVMDAAKNIYYSDFNQHTIRKLTPAGVSSIFAGSGVAGFTNGKGTAASFNNPKGLAIDASGNLYVADGNNHAIRKITKAGVVTTLAGNIVPGRVDATGTAASFYYPSDVALDANGNVFVTDQYNDLIRKITPAGVVSTFAGNGNYDYLDGTGTAAAFRRPIGLVFDAAGNLFVADQYNYRIRKITAAGVVTTVAVNGSTEPLNDTDSPGGGSPPRDIAIDPLNNLYIIDLGTARILKISPTGALTRVAGGGISFNGTGTNARFYDMQGLLYADGNLYVNDNNIRKVSLTGYKLNTPLPAGLNFDPATGTISGTPLRASAATSYSITASNKSGSATASVSIAITGNVTSPAIGVTAPVIASGGSKSFPLGTAITPVILNNTGGPVPSSIFGQVSTVPTTGVGTSLAVVTDAAHNVYIADLGYHVIRKVSAAGVQSIFAGRGSAGFANAEGTSAAFDDPQGLAIDGAGNIYVADTDNNRIRKITPSGVVSTYAGSGVEGATDGAAANATFNRPVGVAADRFGNVYVGDAGNYTIRKISVNGIVTTFAGSGLNGYTDGAANVAKFNLPYSLTTDGAGNVYVADNSNHAIRKITPEGVVSTLAGGTYGSADGTGTAASFAYPQGITADALGNIYVCDSNNHLIRKITPAGVVTTLAGNSSGGSYDGMGTLAAISYPRGIGYDTDGSLFLTENNGLRKISLTGYSFSPALPVGLSFNSSNSTISGTPLQATPTTTYTISAANAGGASTATISIATTGVITALPPAVPAPSITYAGPKSYAAGAAITSLAPVNTGGAVPVGFYGQITTITNNNGTGYGIVTDAAHNIYQADLNQNVIRKISPDGTTVILAGSGSPGFANGTGTGASFSSPYGLAIDASGNIYLSEQGNHAIRKITPAGVVTTLAGTGFSGRANGVGSSATFYNPAGLAVDRFGNIYVADQSNSLIRKIDANGNVSTLAGGNSTSYADGNGSQAGFNLPTALAVDGTGNIYVADLYNNRIRKVTPTGDVTTIAGNGGYGNINGAAAEATFSYPNGIILDASGNILVADGNGAGLIRKITPGGIVSTVAGGGTPGDGNGTQVGFATLQSITYDSEGYLYLSDNGNLRKMALVGYGISSVLPAGLTFEADGTISGTPTLATAAKNYNITASNAGGGSTAILNITVTGTATAPAAIAAPVIAYATPQTYNTGTAVSLSPTNSGGAVPAAFYGQSAVFAGSGTAGVNNATGALASFNRPIATATDAYGNVYVADSENRQIRKITPGGIVTTLAGTGATGAINGPGNEATFYNIQGIAVDASGNVYVADMYNSMIRKITPAGVVSTLAGNSAGFANGTGSAASFYYPMGLAVDNLGNVYVADTYNHRIRKITAAGVVTTLAGSGNAGADNGTGEAANFYYPQDITVDASRNVYVSDRNYQFIRKITPSGVVTTFAGSGTAGQIDGPALTARFNNPGSITVDKAGNIYVLDITAKVIRKISAGAVSTFVSVDYPGLSTLEAGISTDPNGNIYLSDANAHKITKISANGYVTDAALPVGLTLNSATGAISGTPTAPSAAANYNITAYNGGGSSTATVNIAVNGNLVTAPNVAAPQIAYITPQSFTVGTSISNISPANSGGAVPDKVYARSSTIANNNYFYTSDLVTDAAGNIYVAAAYENRIYKKAPNGQFTVFAGNGNADLINGKGTAASFNGITGMAIDAAGNIYVADANNKRVRKISPAGVVSTLASNSGFSNLEGITVDPSGNVYVADQGNHLIRKITPAGTISNFAGSLGNAGFANGSGTTARFNSPKGLASDQAGNIYVADQSNYRIRKITPAGVVTTLAGNGDYGSADGTATSATFANLADVTVDKANNVYAGDNNIIRRITPAGVVTTIAGSGGSMSDGIGTGAQFGSVSWLTINEDGLIHLVDNSYTIRTLSVVGYKLNTELPAGLSFDPSNGVISGTAVAATAAANYTVTAFNNGGSSTAIINIGVTGTLTTPAPTTPAPAVTYASPKVYPVGQAIAALTPTNAGGTVPGELYGRVKNLGQYNYYDAGVFAIDAANNVYHANSDKIYRLMADGTSSVFVTGGSNGPPINGIPTSDLSGARGMVFDAAGNLYITDNGGQNSIRKITPSGSISVFAGTPATSGLVDGSAGTALFTNPSLLTTDRFGNLYVVHNNNTIRRLNAAGVVTTLAGNGVSNYNDGTGKNAGFVNIVGMAIDAAGNIYVTDNDHIRKVTPAGVVTTYFANTEAGYQDGALAQARFSGMQGIDIDAAGNIFIADANNNRIRKITPAGIVSTVAGSGVAGSAEGIATGATFSYPKSLAVNKTGSLYVGELYGYLRQVSVAGYGTSGTLPAGLAFNETTGAITGIPLQATAATNYTINAYNTGGSSTSIINITVTGTIAVPPPTVAAPSISYATPVTYAAGENMADLAPTNTGGAIPAAVYGQTTTLTTEVSNISNFYSLATDAQGNLFVPTYGQIIKVTPAGVVNVFAGNGSTGYANGTGTEASFNNIQALAFDAAGNMYAAESGNNRIRKITPAGVVTNYAGNGTTGRADGPAASATFSNPSALAVDMFGNVYVADNGNYVIRKITPEGIVSTLAGSGSVGNVSGSGQAASIGSVAGMTIDRAGNLYITDASYHLIRKITLTGVVSVFAGTGEAGAVNGAGNVASFYSPLGITIDQAGNLYVAESSNRLIRKITPAGVVSTLAGNSLGNIVNGTGTTAGFYNPYAVAADLNGNLYVADAYNQIRKIAITGYTLTGTLPTGMVFDGTTGTISGTPLTAKASTNYTVTGYNVGGSSTTTVNLAVTGTAVAPIAVAAPGISYVTPKTYGVGFPIAPLTPANAGGAIPAGIYGGTTTLAGDGQAGRNDGSGTNSSFSGLKNIATDVYGNVYVTDDFHQIVRRITPTGTVTTFAGSGVFGFADGVRTAASFGYPAGIAIDKNSNVYVADSYNHSIRKISASGTVTTLAGTGSAGSTNGTGTAASFYYPQGIAVDKNNNVYLADGNNYLLRKITPAGVVTTLAGNGTPGNTSGTGTNASFGLIKNIAVDDSNNIYMADCNNYVIRKVTPAGVVSIFAGSGNVGFGDGQGAAASFSQNFGLATDAAGNVYVADAGNNLIRKITPAGLVTTIAGNGDLGASNGIATDASFNGPQALAVDVSGNVYIADSGNNTIRRVSTSGYTIDMDLPEGLQFAATTGTISGTPTAPSPATDYNVTGYNASGSSNTNVNITVIYPPVVNISSPVTAFASMGDVPPVPVVIDNVLTVTDLSKTTLASGKVSITGNFVAAQDVLTYNYNAATMGNITASYNAATGIMSLSSAGTTATLAQWRTALRSITYNNLNNVAPNTANRTISFILNDGVIDGAVANKTIGLTYTPSSNANLTSLSLSTGTLSPAYSQSITAYAANVPNGVTTIKVSPVTESTNATVTVNGTAVASGAESANIPLSVGTNTITTLVTAQDQVTKITYATTVTRAGIQTITFNNLGARTYGVADFALTATSTNNTIPVTYTSSDANVATIVNGVVHVVGAGTTTITALQTGNANFDPATPVNRTLTINPKALTIVAANKTKVYGAANPALTVTYSGFATGESSAVLTALPAITTPVTVASPAGTYAITASGASAANYTIAYTTGTFTVGKATLTINATSKTKIYGAALPPLTYTATGFVNGDAEAVIITAPNLSTSASATTAVGSYTITASGASAANYNLAYVPGTLSITAAALSIKADNKFKFYGDVNPPLTASYTGFVNGDSQAGLLTLPTLSTTAVTASNVGVYPITASGASSSNYSISYVGGTLTVNSIPLTFNPIPSKVYGDADFAPATSTATVAYSSSNPSVATIVNGSVRIVGVGTTTITGNNGSETQSQTLTVAPAPLTVAVANATRSYGLANPEFALIYTGFVNGDTQAAFTTLPSASTTATPSSPVGNYAVTPTGGISSKYNITYAAGTLTISQAALTITADNKSKAQGAANPTLTASYSGFVNNESPAVLTTQPTLSTAANTSSAAGTYPINIGGATSTNYAISHVAGVLTVTGSNFTFNTIAAKTYGAADFSPGATSTNPVNYSSSDTTVARIVAGNIRILKAGTTTITAYDGFSTLTQTLTVNKALLTVTADNKTKVQGAANPALTASFAGFVNGNTQANLTTQPVLTTTATTSSAAGNYPITASGAASNNYSFTYVAGILTVTPAAAPAPVIASLSPSLGVSGTAVIIRGTNLSGATSVTFGGVAANTFYVNSATQITAIVGTGNTGDVIITTPGGSISKSGFVYTAKPAIAYDGPKVYATGTAITPLLPVVTGGAIPVRTYATVTNFAGNTTSGASNGTGTDATFNGAVALTRDPIGNIYVADTQNHLIRKITAAGVVTTLAGNGSAGFVNGTGSAASFNTPSGIASDIAGNLYVADKQNNVIRKVTPTGIVTTFAGSGTYGAVNGTGTAASFNGPLGVATDLNGNVYVADAQNNLIRKITPAGVVTTLAGSGLAGAANGVGTAASFKNPVSLVVDLAGNIFVADQQNNMIRKITKTGTVTTHAGNGASGATNGTGAAATFNAPYGVTMDAANYVYVADYNSHVIRRVNSAGAVTTVAGSGTAGNVNANATLASFQNPQGISFDGLGSLFVSDGGNHQLIRKIALIGYRINPTLPSGLIFTGSTGTISGTPTAASGQKTYTITAYNISGGTSATVDIGVTKTLNLPQAPAITYASKTFTTGTTITSLKPVNTGGSIPSVAYAQVTTFAGKDSISGYANGTGTAAMFSGPRGVSADASNNLYVIDQNNGRVRKITSAGVVTTYAGSGAIGSANGPALSASFDGAKGIATDGIGNVYVAETSNGLLRKISASGQVTTIASLGTPRGITADASGTVYVADQGTNRIVKITSTGVVSTFAGSGATGFANGQGTAASFTNPFGLAIDAAGNLYVNDDVRIRKITPAGLVSTIAGGATSYQDGTGTAAGFINLKGLTIDKIGNLYAIDEQRIRKITQAGVVTTVAGSGAEGSTNGVGTAATFSYPHGLTADAAGNLFIADTSNELIRKIALNGYSISPALPAGLSFNATNGTITGTPSVAMPTTTFTVTANNAGGSSAATFTLTVNQAVVPLPSAPNISYASQTFTKGEPIPTLTPGNSGGAVPAKLYGQVSTISQNLVGYSLVIDNADNGYFTDGISRIYRLTPAGVVTVWAGTETSSSLGGNRTVATFNQPLGLALDTYGNMYVGEMGSQMMRKITTDGNVLATPVAIGYPEGMAVNSAGEVYISDQMGAIIKKVATNGSVTNFVGGGGSYQDGTGAAAGFSQLRKLVMDANNNIYATDSGNQNIRKITPAGVVTTFANGFIAPIGLAIDPLGNFYVADYSAHVIKKVTPAGVVSVFAGSGIGGVVDGIGTGAQLKNPNAIALDNSGNLIVLQNGAPARRISVTGYAISPALPAGLTFDVTTGNISGTPTAASPATNYTITAYNAGGSSSSTFSLTVNNPVPSIPPPSITYASNTYQANAAISPLTPSNTGGAIEASVSPRVSTVAGNGTSGNADGTGTAASFNETYGVATDAAGNVYVADFLNHRIRKVTPAGVVTTLAGSSVGLADGTGAAAQFNTPRGVAVDAAGNVYVADSGNNLIRRITPAGVVTTLTNGGFGAHTGGGSYNVTAIAVDASNNFYVVDNDNYMVRKVTPSNVVTTLAGNGNYGSANGTGNSATFGAMQAIALDASGNVYVSDMGILGIRKITPAGVVTTLAGSGSYATVDGVGTAASFKVPAGLAVDAAGNIFVADNDAHLIRRITPAGAVTTYAGTGVAANMDGTVAEAGFNAPSGLAVDKWNTLYVSNLFGSAIRKIYSPGYVISPALPAGLALNAATGVINGTPTVASPATSYTVVASNDGGSSMASFTLAVVNPSNPNSAPVISYAAQNFTKDVAITPVAPAHAGGAVPASIFSDVTTIGGNNTAGTLDGTGIAARFRTPAGMAFDQAGNIFIADLGGHVIRKMTPAGVVTTFAGSGTAGFANGTGTAASFNYPNDIAIDVNDNLYVADRNGQRIRKITPAGVVTTFAGSGASGSANGTGTAASFSSPTGITIDVSGNLYVTDSGNNLIRKITAAGVVSTFAGSTAAGLVNGTGTAARFRGPADIAVDAAGNLYVADGTNYVVRKITPQREVTTYAGTGTFGTLNGTAANAQFGSLIAIAVDHLNNVYVGDYSWQLVRKITPDGKVTTLAGKNYATYVHADGVGADANFSVLSGLAIDANGDLFVGNTKRVRKIELQGYGIKPSYEGDPTVPPGLAFDATTGTLSGTPTTVANAKGYTITAYNYYGSNAATFTITVSNPPTLAALPAKKVDNATALVQPTANKVIETPQGGPVVNPALSPNGDGRNDVLQIDGIQNYPDNKVTLMNRNGDAIYQALKYDNAGRSFDGHGSNGKMMPAGTYFYLLEYKDADGSTKRKTGFFVLKF